MPYKDPEAARRNAQERYLRNREARLEAERLRRLSKRDEINERVRERRKQWSPEKRAAAAEYDRRWYAEHPGVKRERGRKRRAAHPEDREYHSQWQQAHPEAVRAYTSQRRGRAVVGMTEQDKRESIEWRKLIKDDPCFYCGTESAEAYEDDHYVSVANGGTDHWWNLVRACKSCNRAKLTLNGDEFLALAR